MPLNTKRHFFLFFIACFFVLLGLAGCASIQAPTGGPKDSIPPKILKETPKNFTTQFKANEINVEFDEYFKLNNSFKEISLSPATEKLPEYKVRKKILNIRFQDTLAPNTTYTINFGNAIADYNESNILKNYVYVLSTGNKIDSLSISGKVINAVTKKPELDATAFIIPLSQDTVFGKKRAPIFTSTDSAGNFSLKYLRGDTYRIYAIKEEGGGDKIYNSTNELIAFLKDSIVLGKDTSGLKLELFKEEPDVFKLKDRKIENTGRISFIFNKELIEPSLRILHPSELDSKKIVEFSRTNDTAYIWTENMNFDSISVAISDKNVSIDTTNIRRNKRDNYKQEITISDNIPSSAIKPGTRLQLTFTAPVSSINPGQINLLQDSVPVKNFTVVKDSSSTRKFYISYTWRKKRQYILDIPENTVNGTYGGKNKAYNKQFTLDEIENYGNLSVLFTVPDTGRKYIIQLLDAQENIIKSNTITTSAKLDYIMYPVGKYRFRVIYDDNKNDKWDTGKVSLRRQPEIIWNNPNEITLRANWDLEEKITIPPPL